MGIKVLPSKAFLREGEFWNIQLDVGGDIPPTCMADMVWADSDGPTRVTYTAFRS